LINRVKEYDENGKFPVYEKIESTKRIPTRKYFL